MIRQLARATLATPTHSKRTELMEVSGQTLVFEGLENTPPNIAPTPDFSDVSCEPSGGKKKATPREIVDELHLCTLIAAYNVHFEKYSEGKTNVNQLIPKLVWKSVYAAYKVKYPDSPFRTA